MKILDRYIIRKFFVTFLFMLGVLALLIVVIDFSEKLDDFLEKQIPLWDTATVYYPNLVIFLANMLCPLCVFLSVIIFTTKMAQDTEIVAILSGGVSYYRLLVPYLGTSLAIGAVSFGFNAYLAPEAVRKRMDFEYRFIKNKDEYGRRHLYTKIGKNDFAYMYSYNPYEYSGYQFSLMRYEGGKLVEKWNAQKVVWNPEKKSWRLEQPEHFVFNGPVMTRKRVASFDTVVALHPDDVYRRDNYAESLPINELYALIEREEDRGSDTVKDLILEKYERWAFPFATPILTLIAVALSSRKRRGGLGLQLGLGLLIAFLYILLLSTAKVAIGDKFPAWLALWLPNIIFLAVAFVLVRRAPK